MAERLLCRIKIANDFSLTLEGREEANEWVRVRVRVRVILTAEPSGNDQLKLDALEQYAGTLD